MLRVSSLDASTKIPDIFKDLPPKSNLAVTIHNETKRVDWIINGEHGSLGPASFATGYGPKDWINPRNKNGTTRYRTDEMGNLYTCVGDSERLIVYAPVWKK